MCKSSSRGSSGRKPAGGDSPDEFGCGLGIGKQGDAGERCLQHRLDWRSRLVVGLRQACEAAFKGGIAGRLRQGGQRRSRPGCFPSGSRWSRRDRRHAPAPTAGWLGVPPATAAARAAARARTETPFRPPCAPTAAGVPDPMPVMATICTKSEMPSSAPPGTLSSSCASSSCKARASAVRLHQLEELAAPRVLGRGLERLDRPAECGA